MLKSLLRVVFVVFAVTAFMGCESNNSFMTVAGIDAKLQGTWKMVRIPVATVENQHWKFDNGKIYITYDSLDVKITRRDTGTYSIVAKIATSYIVIDDPVGNQYVAGRWVVINIDDKYLTLNRQSDGTYGTKQREFVKQ